MRCITNSLFDYAMRESDLTKFVVVFEHDELLDLYDELRHLGSKQVTKLLEIMQLHLGANINAPET